MNPVEDRMSQTIQSDAGRLFREGKLADAVAAANAAVRKSTTDLGARMLLAELLVFTGNLERADVILDACGDLDPTVAIVVAEFRQLVRGEVARRQLFRDGRLPEFLGEPNAAQRASLAALVALREWRPRRRRAARGGGRNGADTPRGHPSWQGTGTARRIRRLSRCRRHAWPERFEVITTTGKYYWIPAGTGGVTIEFHPPKRPRDLVLAPCFHAGGAADRTGTSTSPRIYPVSEGADATVIEALRLGRHHRLACRRQRLRPVRGAGAVTTWLVGEDSGHPDGTDHTDLYPA